MKTVLHVGAGHRRNGASLPSSLRGAGWREVRLDIDPANEPDLVGSMLDMVAVAPGSMDAVYSAHNIEHVHAHEVPAVLREFRRVLAGDGFLVLTCPDLLAVCAAVVAIGLEVPAYVSPAGPVTPHDILYGHGEALAAGHSFMAHRCGFTLPTLVAVQQAAGFTSVAGLRRPSAFDLWTVATVRALPDAEIRKLATLHLPA